jgi:hypothetical protein
LFSEIYFTFIFCMPYSAHRRKYAAEKYYDTSVHTTAFKYIYSLIYTQPSFIISSYHGNVIRGSCVYQLGSIISETTEKFSITCDNGKLGLKCGQVSFLLIYIDGM